MDINVAQLLKSHVGESREYDIDESLPTIDEYPTVEPVRGRVKLTRTNRGILVEASLGTAVKLPCSRCLDELIAPLRVRFREEFLPTVDVVTGVPLEISPEEDASFTIDEHHILDLAEPIRQYGLLEVPMQPLCREECAGLCPTCGQNRNLEPCACPTEPANAGLGSLASLLSQEDDKE